MILSILIISKALYNVNIKSSYIEKGVKMYNKLESILKERGLTKYRLAKMSKISVQDIYSILNGKKPLYPNWKKRISEALDVPEEELFEEEG